MLTTEDFKKQIEVLSNGKYLSYDEGKSAFEYIMTGNATDILISSFLTSLKIIFINSGISHDLIAAGADIMREKAIKIKASDDTIDIVGTGGDGHNTLNISTATALVISGTGIKVAKHGNYSASSMSGSADVLISLGINIKNDISNVQKCLDECGICFLFAPKHHSAMKHVMNVRKELHFRTIFNLLGPLSNPAFVKKQLVGVYDKSLLMPFAKALKKLGSTNAWIVSSDNGMDEVTTTGKTFGVKLLNGKLSEFELEPKTFGIEKVSIEKLKGGDPNYNAKEIMQLLNGEKGPFRDIVKVNAICSILASGLTNNVKEASEMVTKSIDSKSALEKLNLLKQVSNT